MLPVTGPVRPGPVRPGPVRPGPVRSGPDGAPNIIFLLGAPGPPVGWGEPWGPIVQCLILTFCIDFYWYHKEK